MRFGVSIDDEGVVLILFLIAQNILVLLIKNVTSCHIFIPMSKLTSFDT